MKRICFIFFTVQDSQGFENIQTVVVGIQAVVVDIQAAVVDIQAAVVDIQAVVEERIQLAVVGIQGWEQIQVVGHIRLHMTVVEVVGTQHLWRFEVQTAVSLDCPIIHFDLKRLMIYVHN